VLNGFFLLGDGIADSSLDFSSHGGPLPIRTANRFSNQLLVLSRDRPSFQSGLRLVSTSGELISTTPFIYLPTPASVLASANVHQISSSKQANGQHPSGTTAVLTKWLHFELEEVPPSASSDYFRLGALTSFPALSSPQSCRNSIIRMEISMHRLEICLYYYATCSLLPR